MASGTMTNAELTVYGHLDQRTLEAIDRVADQMLMPRSWVVTQILREWEERRRIEIDALEESWNGSYREEISQLSQSGVCDDCQPI